MERKPILGGPLGFIIEGPLTETEKGVFQLKVSRLGMVTWIQYDTNKHEAYYGAFQDIYAGFNSGVQMGQDQRFWDYIKRIRK